MKKTTKHICISIIISIFWFQNLYSQTVEKYTIKKVVIDAGHGGKDPGAIGDISYEKDITLKIVLKLGEYIDEYLSDVDVIYTRKTDEFIELKRRAEIANENKADLFISIHVNSSLSSTPTGTSTYVMGLHKTEENLEVAKIENSAIYIENNYEENYETFNTESPETYIILNLYQNIYIENSLIFATKVQEQFKTRAGKKDLGVKQAGLLVLWQTTMPSVLIETGFISNPEDETYLASDYGQSIIASAIFRAFRDYKLQIENNSDFNVMVDTNLTTNEIVDKYTKDEIFFRVQVKSSTVRLSLKSKEFEKLDSLEEIVCNGVYKYTIGKTADYNKIIEIQNETKKIVPDAFVIAFKNGDKITVNEAIKELKK